MKKILTGICSVALLCGAATGLALTTGAFPSNVQAKADGQVYDVPFTSDFDAGLDEYLVINVNEDDYTWARSNPYGSEYANGTIGVWYNWEKDSDDWIFTPGFNLMAGKKYVLSFNASGSSYGEKLAIKIGTERSIDGMTQTIFDNYYTDYASHEEEVEFTPAEDGVYYIGFYCYSPANGMAMYVSNFTLDEWKEKVWPSEVTDFKVTRDENGELKATVELTAPVLNAGQTELDNITKIEVLLDGDVVKTFDNPTPGEKLVFEYETEEARYLTFSAVAYNEAGQSKSVTSNQAYVGTSSPGSAYINNVKRADEPGYVTVEWQAVTSDRLGNKIDGSLVTYSVGIINDNYQFEAKAEDVTETSYTFKAVEEGLKEITVAVISHYKDLDGQMATSYEKLLAGFPYENIDEQFVEDGEYYWKQTFTNDTYDKTIKYTFDADGGYVEFNGWYDNTKVSLYSGLLSVPAAKKKTLDFEVKAVSLGTKGDGKENGQKIAFTVIDENGNYYNLFENALSTYEAGADGWYALSADLSNFAGQTIQFYFTATLTTGRWVPVYVRNIHTVEPLGVDLRANIEAPAQVQANKDFTVNVKVTNDGVNTVESYVVNLYNLNEGEEPVQTLNCGPIAGLSSENVEFTVNMPFYTEFGSLCFMAEVVADEDEVAYNNQTEIVEVGQFHSDHNPVTIISHTYDIPTQTLNITWEAPEAMKFDGEASHTDTFEDGVDGENAYGDWKFYSNAGLNFSQYSTFMPTGVFNQFQYNGATPCDGFYIYSNLTAKATVQDNAHNGDKCLYSPAKYGYGQSDDWAISPELSGNEQTITLYARGAYAAGAYGSDSIELLYSISGTSESDFISVKSETFTNTMYNEYSFVVPEGAKYFAIHRTGNGGDIWIDDVKYQTAADAAAAVAPQVVGYHVFFDGEQIAENHAETSLDHVMPIGTTHNVLVAAVYDNGEVSAPQIHYVDFTTTVDAIEADYSEYDAVYTLDGVRVNRDNIAAGIYVVVKNGKSSKVLVK